MDIRNINEETLIFIFISALRHYLVEAMVEAETIFRKYVYVR